MAAALSRVAPQLPYSLLAELADMLRPELESAEPVTPPRDADDGATADDPPDEAVA
jgi:hypothetical protein